MSEDPETQVNWVSEAVVSVYASKEVEINGALGQCHSLMKKKPFVSSKVIGKGNTHSWYLGSLDKDKTITICYELALPEAKQQVPLQINSTISCNSRRSTGTGRGTQW